MSPVLASAPSPKKPPATYAAATSAPRFTLDGDDALEADLARTCAAIFAGVRGIVPGHRLEAVLLGGGYGRGEGGVRRTYEGDRPYNDLEFYVCVRGNRHLNARRYHLPLEVLGEILSPRAGVEVEFKITSLENLRREPVSMFSYDLILGHRLLTDDGDGDRLAGFTRHRHAADIPLSEATRLLMNRCSGLLFAQERLARREFTSADADFVRRNIAKAELAFGDALLAAHGRYHWSVAERHRRLLELVPAVPLAWLPEVRRRHASAMSFKLRPERGGDGRDLLAARHADVVVLGREVWLWQERRRLDVGFDSIGDYIGSRIDKCPETDPGRNLLVNLKLGGPAALLRPARFRHPRESVFHALCRLLWEPAAAKVAAAEFSARVAAYADQWQRVH